MSDIDYALMQQRPSVSFLEHSALTRADRSPISGSNPVMLTEQPAGHLVLRGTPAEFSGAVRETLQLESPTLPLTSNTSDTGACIRWISPDEWLITVPEADTFEVESALRTAIDSHVAIVNVSGGQTILQLQGDEAETVLRKSTPYDVHASNFPVGKVVTTAFAQTQVLMRRLDTDAFELVIRRSFADYIWAWLRDAAEEFGLKT